jgi:hypothetical protein
MTKIVGMISEDFSGDGEPTAMSEEQKQQEMFGKASAAIDTIKMRVLKALDVDPPQPIQLCVFALAEALAGITCAYRINSFDDAKKNVGIILDSAFETYRQAEPMTVNPTCANDGAAFQAPVVIQVEEKIEEKRETERETE